METIVNAVKKFFERYPTAEDFGRLTHRQEIDTLSLKSKKAIPVWYKDLLLEFPIADLPLAIPNDFGQPFLKGKPKEQLPLLEITFHSVQKIEEVSDSNFANYILPGKRIVCIAEDRGSTGEGIFIDPSHEDPPPVLIFHDMGGSIKELMAKGEKLADKFSDVFTFGKLANERIKLTSDNEQPAVLLIDQFFKQIEAELASGHNQLREKLSDPARLIEGIQQRDDAIRKNDYISGLLKFEYGLYDSGYPLSKDHLHLLVEIYRTCGLHVAELVYLESRVNNSLS